jgi:tRNA threonylcarbamoyladenosine biosynthesis protein TsaB
VPEHHFRLAVDTATEVLSVALVDGARTCFTASEDFQAGAQARRVLPLMLEALASEGIGVADLDAFVVSLGPGSFTGIRIGVSTVQAVAWALAKPVLAGGTLDALALGAGPHPGPVVPLLDARKEEVYGAVYGPGARLLDGPWLLAPDGVAGRLAQAARAAGLEGPPLLLGRGLRRYRDALLAGPWAQPPREAPMAADLVSAEWLARSVARRPAVAGDALEPLYLRKSEAEANWERAQATRD